MRSNKAKICEGALCVLKNKDSRAGNCREWQEAGRSPETRMATAKYSARELQKVLTFKKPPGFLTANSSAEPDSKAQMNCVHA